MKILIAYYSRTGGTEKVAEALKKEFEVRGHSIDVEKVKPVKEHSFLTWFAIRTFKGECEIQPPKIKDLSKYDAVCIGSPNWTRLSLPMARHLREVKGLKYKDIGFFATTALEPRVEWYILSAYFLDLTFSRIIDRKEGRIIDSILLSTLLRRWNFASEYGKKVIKNFCDKIETPIPSLKNYILGQKEIEGARLLIIIFSILLFFSLLYQIISTAVGAQIFTWNQYLSLFVIGFLAYFLMLITMASKVGIFLGKYLSGAALVLGWTLIVLFLTPILGKLILLGYVLIFIFISFFRELKTVLSTGLVAVLSYGFLFFNYPQEETLQPSLDLTLLFLSLGVISFITQRLQKHYLALLEAQEEIEKERDTTLTIINNLVDGLLLFNKENKLSLVNPEAENLFDLRREETTGKLIKELSISSLKPLVELLEKNKEILRKELKIREGLILEVSTIPMVKEEESGTLVILHDITKEKRVERLKTEFVSLVAHQLRTPLSAIKWTLRMLSNEELGKVNKEQKKYLNRTYQSNERMISLINDLLNVTRIEEGRYVYQPKLVHLENLIQAVIDSLKPEIKRKNIELDFQKPKQKLPEVKVDMEKIKLAIRNLVDNAIEYSSKGSKVIISLEQKENNVQFSVQDNGIGIPKKQQKRIFAKFFRGANAIKMETEGSGLGLFIVKNIIEAHQGKIWFESEQGKGTTFYFTLPY